MSTWRRRGKGLVNNCPCQGMMLCCLTCQDVSLESKKILIVKSCMYLTLHFSSSIVGFGGKQRSMGLSAKNQMITNFRNTIWGFKTLVGRKFSDPFVQEEIKQFPFEVVQLPNDGIGIKVGILNPMACEMTEKILNPITG